MHYGKGSDGWGTILAGTLLSCIFPFAVITFFTFGVLTHFGGMWVLVPFKYTGFFIVHCILLQKNIF